MILPIRPGQVVQRTMTRAPVDSSWLINRSLGERFEVVADWDQVVHLKCLESGPATRKGFYANVSREYFNPDLFTLETD